MGSSCARFLKPNRTLPVFVSIPLCYCQVANVEPKKLISSALPPHNWRQNGRRTIIHNAIIRGFVCGRYFAGDERSRDICRTPTAKINQEDKFEIALGNNRRTIFLHASDNFCNLFDRKVVDRAAFL